MSETVIVNAGDTAETASEAAAVAETTTEAAVEIAQIEADKEIKLAEIAAETQTAANETMLAQTAIASQTIGDEWTTRLASLEASQAEIAGQLAACQAMVEALTTSLSSTQPAAPETVVVTEPEITEVVEPEGGAVDLPVAETRRHLVRLL